MGNIFVGDLPLGTNIASTDYVVGISGSRTVKMQCRNFLGGTWEELQDKPFDSLSSEYFTIDTTQDNDGNVNRILSLNNNAIIPEETKQQINTNAINISGLEGWTSYFQTLGVKESDIFEGSTSENYIGSGMPRNDKLFQICLGLINKMGLTFSTNNKIQGKMPFIINDASNLCQLSNTESSIYGNNIDNINAQMDGVVITGIGSVTTSDGTYYFPRLKANSGVNFSELSNMMTTGTQSGITIVADTDNQRFNFEVTGLPTIAIDSEGYWTIDGNRGENPTKAQGERGSDGTNGKDGASPTIDPTTKNWIVGTVDTGVKAEAQSNYFYTGTEFPTSDLIDGDLYLSFADDTKGNVYQYQESTLDWSLQGNLYGGGAVIDDNSTGNTVTWSASKINSMIGDINTILASVTGGIE